MKLFDVTLALLEAAIEDGMSTKQIAEGAKVSQRYIDKIRSPKSKAKASNIHTIQKIYDYLSQFYEVAA